MIGDDQDLFSDPKNLNFTKSDNEDASHVHGHSHTEDAQEPQGCSLTPIVLMLALSTHAVFEGLAVGLENNKSNLWTLVLAISCHKWAEGLCLGISMSKQFHNQDRLVFILMSIFALATPLGVGLGMILSGEGALINIIFTSMAGGTFLYISASEVVVEEFST